MPTVYTPVLRVRHGTNVKMPTLPGRPSKTEALLALEEAIKICVDLGWTVEYQNVAMTDGQPHAVDTHRTNLLEESLN